MKVKRTNSKGIEVAVRAISGEFELGIEHLALILEYTPGSTDLRTLVELKPGICDADAITALKELVGRIEIEGLPRFAPEQETENSAGLH